MLVACCQLAPNPEDLGGTSKRLRTAIREATDLGADLVVLPELVTTGYVFSSGAEAHRRAAAAAGEARLEEWAEEAAKGDTVVVGGFCEAGEDGSLFNSAGIVDASGVLAVYRKGHLWDREQLIFTPGNSPAPVVDTKHGRIGLAICYDLEFPEMTRGLALRGADIIAIPTNWPSGTNAPDGNQAPLLATLGAATAYLSRVFVAICDRCGEEQGMRFEGGSVIADPDGRLLAGPVADKGSAIVLAECELDRARQKATGQRNNAFADRRPELYESVLNATG